MSRTEDGIGCVGPVSSPTKPIANLRRQFVLSQRFLCAFFKFIEKGADDTGLTRRHRQFTNVTPPCGINFSKPFLLHPLSRQFLSLPLLLSPTRSHSFTIAAALIKPAIRSQSCSSRFFRLPSRQRFLIGSEIQVVISKQSSPVGSRSVLVAIAGFHDRRRSSSLNWITTCLEGSNSL
jgi:hypothetical protein